MGGGDDNLLKDLKVFGVTAAGWQWYVNIGPFSGSAAGFFNTARPGVEGVLVGLILVQFTGIAMLDSIVALLVAVLIGRTALSTMRKSFGGLMDIKLPQAEEDKIVACLSEHTDLIASFHRVRTRKAGSQRQIDFHMVVSRHISVERAHQLCDQLEEDIEKRLSDTSVTIHVEPCDGNCEECSTSPDLCQPR